MNPGSHTPSYGDHEARRDKFLWVLGSFIGYCTLCCSTVPFASRVWLGELPLLAVIQVPKIIVANWLRKHVVMKAITFLGFSRGSFSPDYILARPYALAIAYLIPIVIISVITLRQAGFVGNRRKLLLAVFYVVAILDYTFTLIFGGGPGFTIYG